MAKTRTRRRIIVDNSALARAIGERLRIARRRAGLTQQQLAEGRYTKAYVSALEHGLVKPSVAALTFFAERLGVPPSALIADAEPAWSRLEADLLLASGAWPDAADAYRTLLDSETDPQRRAELLRGLAEALVRLDRGGEAAAPAAEAQETFARLGRREDAALAAYWLAAAEYQLDNLAEARSILRTLLDEVRAGLRVEPGFRHRLLIALASIESRTGDHTASLAYLEEVRGIVEELDLRRQGTFLFDLAHAYRETGDLEAAIRTATRALALFRASESEADVAGLENDLALAHLALGNVERARDYAHQAEARFRRLGDRRMLAHVLETEAAILAESGELERALEVASDALATAREAGNPKAELASLVRLGKVRDALGQRDEALEAFAEAG
ncbi:MAG TPA: helix-turn-helix transcriptional regulator, partial [Candidatus Limnocylindrales bacterium]|nr:helix-turn-helix transcriptional regulator [Candidatus Limnocylindrales bacterium]